MGVSRDIRELLDKFQREIQMGDWAAVYDQVASLNNNLEFSEMLDKAGVNPFPKMVYIPEWSFANLDNVGKDYNIKFLKAPTFYPQLKKIGGEAFFRLKDLVELSLPGTVSYIGHEAFFECGNLRKVVAGKGDEIALNTRSFARCTDLELVDFSGYRRGSVHVGAFKYDFTLKKVLLPSSLDLIGNGAFSYCTNLQDIYIPEGVPYLSERLFDGCRKLRTVRIPGSAIKAFEKAFRGCDNLEFICYGGNKEMFEKLISNSSKDIQDILSRPQLRVVFER